MRHAAPWIGLLALLGCSDAVGPVPVDASAPAVDGGPTDAGPSVDAQVTHPDAGPRDAALEDSGASDSGGLDAGPRPVDPPPPPEDPPGVQVLSVTVRTGTGQSAGSDSPAQLCVAPGVCFGLDTPDVDDRTRGGTEVFHFPVALADGAVQGVTLEATSSDPDDDRWTPACVDLRVDGRPIYCNDALGVHIGTGDSSGEHQSWTDPGGLTQSCASCWGSTLTHGPLLGAPGPDRIRVWVRTDATRRVALRVGQTSDLRDGVVLGWAWPLPQDDFTATIEARGLLAGREYFYRVEVDGDLGQPIRPARTAPAPDDPAPIRLAFGSCTKRDEQPIFSAISAQSPDLFLMVGDNHYGNTPQLAAHRWQYRRFRAVPERAALMASVPTLATWDDHDFVGNNSNGTCEGRDAALRGFSEYWANPSYGLPAAPGTYFRQRWGAAELFVLDCRSYRPDVQDGNRDCTVDPGAPALRVEDGPLGPAQEAWLLEALEASDATFKLLACGSRFTSRGSTDSWASFDAARERLLDAIALRGVGGVVFLSGDIHRSVFGVVPGPAYDIPELTSSSLAYTAPSVCNPVAQDQLACYGGLSFITLELDPGRADPELVARIHDRDGLEIERWVILRSTLE